MATSMSMFTAEFCTHVGFCIESCCSRPCFLLIWVCLGLFEFVHILSCPKKCFLGVPSGPRCVSISPRAACLCFLPLFVVSLRSEPFIREFASLLLLDVFLQCCVVFLYSFLFAFFSFFFLLFLFLFISLLSSFLCLPFFSPAMPS